MPIKPSESRFATSIETKRVVAGREGGKGKKERKSVEAGDLKGVRQFAFILFRCMHVCVYVCRPPPVRGTRNMQYAT